MFKRILKSKWLRLVFSAILIYLAFRKVDVYDLFQQLVGVKWWFLAGNILVSLFILFLISYRWSLLLITKPKIKDVVVFFRSSLIASFYGLFVPTTVGTDFLKWVTIYDKYPKVPKSKLLGSVFVDRFIGMSLYMLVGLVFVLGIKISGLMVPDVVFYLVAGLTLFCLTVYILIYFDKAAIWFGKVKFLKRFESVTELIVRENLGQIFKGVGVSLVSEMTWVTQIWLISCYFGANLNILSVLIYIPIISVILLLPISIAGFGAREQLYLLFFVPLGGIAEGLLLTSTFTGILGILTALIGGLVTLTPSFKRISQSDKI